LKTKIDLLVFPKNKSELKKFLKKNDNVDYAVISNSLNILSYCIQKKIKFFSFNDIVDIDLYKKICINSYLQRFNKFKDKVSINYFFIFKYNFSHIIRTLFLSKLLIDGLNKKFEFKKIKLFSFPYNFTYARSNIFDFLRLLLSLEFNNKLQKKHINFFILKFIVFNFKLANLFSEFIFFFEFLFYKIYYFKKKSKVKFKKNSKSIFFFSSGTDFTFHSKLSRYITEFNPICFKGKSKFNRFEKNTFNSIHSIQFNLLNGFYYKKIINNYNYNFLNKIFEDFIENDLIKDYYIQYAKFRIKRDFKFINSFAFLLNNKKPDLVFSSSLSLPLISAKFLNIRSISEFEGYGIDQNPMAPYIGDYVFLGGDHCEDEFIEYKSGNGKVIKNGVYYIE